MPLFYSRQSKYYAPPSESTRWSLKIYTYIVVVVVVYGSWEYYNRVYCLHNNAADTSLQVNIAGSVCIFLLPVCIPTQMVFRLVLFIASYLVRNDWLPIAFSNYKLHRWNNLVRVWWKPIKEIFSLSSIPIRTGRGLLSFTHRHGTREGWIACADDGCLLFLSSRTRRRQVYWDALFVRVKRRFYSAVVSATAETTHNVSFRSTKLLLYNERAVVCVYFF